MKKGLIVATFSAVMSACFACGLAIGDPIKAITIQHGTPVLWQGLPVLVVVLAGGFTINFIWCPILNIRNRTGYQYFESKLRGKVPARNEEYILEAVTDAPAEEMAVAVAVAQDAPDRAPMVANYLFSARAGTTWYMQFFFYSMGETQMGRYKLQLDVAHGQHHHLQHFVGDCSEGMERRCRQNQIASGVQSVGSGKFDSHCGFTVTMLGLFSLTSTA